MKLVSSFSSFCALAFLLVTLPAVATPVFINEIHYDNQGGDLNEGFEIAGPAATDLTDWQLVLYNGSNGMPYASVFLSGLLSDQINGYGFLSVPVSGIQNGSPDGVALIDHLGAVVQFLSYEGAFSAAAGPASGMSSIDILVFEPTDTALGTSLQLTGAGRAYEDFSWQSAVPQSFGLLNANQNFVRAAVSADVPLSSTLLLFALGSAALGVGRGRNEKRVG